MLSFFLEILWLSNIFIQQTSLYATEITFLPSWHVETLRVKLFRYKVRCKEGWACVCHYSKTWFLHNDIPSNLQRGFCHLDSFSLCIRHKSIGWTFLEFICHYNSLTYKLVHFYTFNRLPSSYGKSHISRDYVKTFWCSSTLCPEIIQVTSSKHVTLCEHDMPKVKESQKKILRAHYFTLV